MQVLIKKRKRWRGGGGGGWRMMGSLLGLYLKFFFGGNCGIDNVVCQELNYYLIIVCWSLVFGGDELSVKLLVCVSVMLLVCFNFEFELRCWESGLQFNLQCVCCFFIVFNNVIKCKLNVMLGGVWDGVSCVFLFIVFFV